jgi:hypothetical protein
MTTSARFCGHSTLPTVTFSASATSSIAPERITLAVTFYDAVRDGQDGRRVLAQKHDGEAS